MAVAGKDGAWVTAVEVVKIKCSKCGLVSISNYPMNDRETDEAVRAHLAKHGGVDRG